MALPAQATITPAFKKKHGIPPKGRGPHNAADYGLPVPPATHPLAKALARKALWQAASANTLQKHSIANVIAQVRKANTVLYGKPNPSQADKAKATATRVAARAADPFGQHESARSRESYMDVSAADGSWEQTSNAILDAARASTLFGGPAIPYSMVTEGLDVVRPYDIQIAVSYPEQSKVIISNGETGEMWQTNYAIDAETKIATFSNTVPAALKIVTKAKEALKRVRESSPQGRHVTHQGIHIESPLLEVAVDDAAGTAHVMIIREGPGNLGDRHWYTKACLQTAVANKIFEGAHNFKDHPTPFEDAQRPERSVKDLGGWFSDLTLGTYQDAALGEVAAIYGTFHPQQGDDLTLNLLRTTQEYQQKFTEGSYVGLSINAFGVGGPADHNGEQWNDVDEMTQVDSVDTVTRAGAKGQIISFQESIARMKNRKPATTTRESFASPEMDFDIRTSEEREADAVKARVIYRTAVRESLLRGPLRESILTELGFPPAVAKAAPPALPANTAPTPQTSAVPQKLTPEQDQALDQMLGIVDGGPFDELLDTALGGNNDMSDDTSETTGSPALGANGALTEQMIDAMDEATAKATLKARALPSTPHTEATTVTESSTTVTETAEVAALKKKLAEANQRADTAEGKITEANRFSQADKIMTELKIPPSFKPICRRYMEAAKTEAELVVLGREWVTAYMPEGDGAGAVGLATRESARPANDGKLLKLAVV